MLKTVIVLSEYARRMGWEASSEIRTWSSFEMAWSWYWDVGVTRITVFWERRCLTVRLNCWDPIIWEKGSMKSIKVISDAFTNTSRFLRLRNAVFLENGFRRSWDYVEVCCFKQWLRIVERLSDSIDFRQVGLVLRLEHLSKQRLPPCFQFRPHYTRCEASLEEHNWSLRVGQLVELHRFCDV